MIHPRNGKLTCFVRPTLALMTWVSLVAANPCTERAFAESPLYFPPAHGKWETVSPAEAGLDADYLRKTLAYAAANRSSGIVILYRGRIVAEQYREVETSDRRRDRQHVLGKDAAGRAIEDVASAQKSVVSVLVGIAQEMGLLEIDDPVSDYLDEGWSQATPRQERSITIRHLITMSSGLTDRGTFEAKPGTQWRYNTSVYAKTMEVLEVAADLDRHELTREWLTQPLGMSDSTWVRRRSPEIERVNGFGFATTARDLARFGLLMLADGKWGDEVIVKDQQFLREATSSSQTMNPHYGYLWWVNCSSLAPADTARQINTAPPDMYAAKGALNRRCFVVPSRHLVVTRLGDQPPAKQAFDRQLWRLLSLALAGPAATE